MKEKQEWVKMQDQKEAKKTEAEKQKLIRSFYKNFLSWKADNIGIWLLSGIAEVLLAGTMLVPYQEIVRDRAMLVFPFVFGMLGSGAYLTPYLYFSEEGKACSIYEKLKYLPVDIRDIKKMRITYLFRLVIKIFPFILCGQLLFAWLFFNEIGPENILYSLVFGLLWPFLSGLPLALASK